MIRVGVVGYGYWGPNLTRAVSEKDALALEMVADMSPAAQGRAARRHPGTRVVADWRDLIADPAIDAVMVATPVHTHFEIARAALRAGKHVLVEKPMTDSPATSALLVEEAARRNRVLMVDHTFVYTGAIQTIADLISSGEVGDIYYYDSTRVNLGLFQRDVNVIWDLAVHDFAIMDYLLKAHPVAISASGAGFVPNSPENMAHLSVFYNDGSMAHLNVNWLAPVKIRQTLIGGSRQMVDLRRHADQREGQGLRPRRVARRGAEAGLRASRLLPHRRHVLPGTVVEGGAAHRDRGIRPMHRDGTPVRSRTGLAACAWSSCSPPRHGRCAMRGQPVELGLERLAS